MSTAASIAPRPIHLTRLKSVWRSAGWPCRDAIELDLLAGGWLKQERDAEGRDTLRLTDTGLQLLAQARSNRTRSASPHDRLAARVCAHLSAQGRIVWRELSLRAKVSASNEVPRAMASPATALPFDDEAGAEDTRLPAVDATGTAWRMARPDVFSIRNTSVAAYLHPVVHEIKTSRADLLSDLRNEAKREAYRWLSCETYYVFPAQIAAPEEVPDAFGILTLNGTIDEGTLTLMRPARHAPCTLPFAAWMALAKSTPVYDDDAEPVQGVLVPTGEHERA